MSDLQQYQDKIRRMEFGNGKNNSIGIKIEHGKPTKIILGLAGNHVTPIAPVTLHLDADDNIKFVELSHISIMLIDYNNQHFDAKKQIPATAN